MFVGSGRCELILPEDFLPTEGFVAQAHPLYVRALTIGAGKPFVLVSIEMTSLPNDQIPILKGVTASSAGTSLDKVWITVTHTFSAPHLLPDDAVHTEADRAKKGQLEMLLQDAVHTAVLKARCSAEEAEISFREGQSVIPASRDIELPEGWWVGCGGEGPANATMTLLQFGDMSPIALLLHMNVQPSVLDGTGVKDGKCISGDIAGIVCERLEQAYPGAVALFIVGAAGDQAPCRKAKGLCRNENGEWHEIDLHEEGVALAEKLGYQLFSEIQALMTTPGETVANSIGVTRTSVVVPAKEMNRNLHALRPVRNCEWVSDGEGSEEISIIRWGSLAIVGVRPELTIETDRFIKSGSPFPHTLMATLVNGSAKYMAARDAYERCMYEAINSPFAPGAAEALAEAAVKELNKLMISNIG